MKPVRLIAAALSGVLLLGACQKEADSGAANASGEVLPGSASDAMLPYDTVRSQPPLAPQTGAPGKAEAEADATDAPEGAASQAAAETPAAPEPEQPAAE